MKPVKDFVYFIRDLPTVIVNQNIIPFIPCFGMSSRDWKHARLQWTSLQILRNIALDNNLRKRIIEELRRNDDWGMEEEEEPYFCYFDESVDFILYPNSKNKSDPDYFILYF
jgi:hypothetical protein